jgi:outer membrane receptor protein involved in Fe transport
LTHAVSSKTYYEISLESFRRDYNTRPSASRDSTLYEIIPGFFETSNPLGYYPYDYTHAVIITGGQHFAKARDFSVMNSTTFKADFSSQVNFQNLVKAGVEFLYNDLNFDYGTIQSGGQPTETYDNRVRMRVFPIQGAFYAQDKLEFKEFTVNLGLRLDYSNSNTEWWNVDPFDNAFFGSTGATATNIPMSKSTPQWQLSPRLGIAHPISENAKLFFNYGHFKEVPQYESMFRLQRNTGGQMTSFGNPNLVLAKTISYELGFDYVMFRDYLLQVAAFYNDISNQQDFTVYNGLTSGYVYTKSTSNNYQDVRGFEITLRRSTGRWWSGFINYTYQVSTTGHFGSSQQFDDIGKQISFDDQTVYTYLDRPLPQPYARANLNFFAPEDFGPAFLGHILGGFGLNVVLDWQDGPWTTWNPGGLSYVAYNVKAVDYFNATMRLDKTIRFGKFRAQLFVDVTNVFNTLRLWNTGDYNYMSSLHLPKSKDYQNMVGDDKVGDYRALGVDFQPMQNGVDLTQPGKARLIYYDNNERNQTYGQYFEYVNNQWAQVDQKRIDKILADKAYIDMPNASTYWFLDPRKIYFGLKISFDFTE